jgi:hypothetical protein
MALVCFTWAPQSIHHSSQPCPLAPLADWAKRSNEAAWPNADGSWGRAISGRRRSAPGSSGREAVSRVARAGATIDVGTHRRGATEWVRGIKTPALGIFVHEATGGLRAGYPKVISARHRSISLERPGQRWDK